MAVAVILQVIVNNSLATYVTIDGSRFECGFEPGQRHGQAGHVAPHQPFSGTRTARRLREGAAEDAGRQGGRPTRPAAAPSVPRATHADSLAAPAAVHGVQAASQPGVGVPDSQADVSRAAAATGTTNTASALLAGEQLRFFLFVPIDTYELEVGVRRRNGSVLNGQKVLYLKFIWRN